jgi:hypothetical protein
MSDPLASLAPKDAVPHYKTSAPLAALGLGPEEGFVLSRVDGRTRLDELLQLVPFPPSQTVEILRRLWIAGAIEIPGHAPPIIVDKPAAPGPPPAPARPASSATVQVPQGVPPGVDLTLEQVRQIDAVFSELQSRNAFDLLGVPRTADKKEVKRAYFKLSKEFHPDRFYGKKLGPYGDRLAQIFQAVKSAFELLSDEKRRAAYEDSLGSG